MSGEVCTGTGCPGCERARRHYLATGCHDSRCPLVNQPTPTTARPFRVSLPLGNSGGHSMGITDFLDGLAEVPAVLKRIEQNTVRILANTQAILNQQENMMSDLDTAVSDLQDAVTDLQQRLQGLTGEAAENVAANVEQVRAITEQIRGIASGSGGGDEPHADQTLPGDLPPEQSGRASRR